MKCHKCNLYIHPYEIYTDWYYCQSCDKVFSYLKNGVDMNKKELLEKLKSLRRPETEEEMGATVSEAIDVLISVGEYLLNSDRDI